MPRRFCVVVLALALPALADAATHPFSAADLVRFARIENPVASPDGRQVAYVLRETDMQADKGRRDIWLVPVKGGQPRRLTTAKADDTSPRWSRDGVLFFLSRRSGRKQVWKIRPDGGEAEPVTQLPLDVNAFAIAPDAKHLAVSVDVFRNCADFACTRARLDANRKSPVSAKSFDRLFVRHWDAWMDGRRSVLFAVPLDDAGLASGEPVSLSGALDADVPSKPFGGSDDFTFSRDGREVIFSARVAGREEPWSTNFDLYRVSVTGGKPESLTADNKAWDATPVVSPDGRQLAWRAMRRPGFESDRFGLRLRDLKTGVTREIAGDWDRSVSKLDFAPDSRSLIVTAPDHGATPLWRVAVDGAKPVQLAGDGNVGAFTLAGRDVVFLRDDLRSPADLYRVGMNGRGDARLTQVNAERLARIRMGEFEQFSFPGANGDRVFGYVVKPADFEAGRTYPVAFLIHGGPEGSFGNHFHYRWNPQTYAGAGYAAVMVDFHGSTGYGQTFTDAIQDDWGGKPLVDLRKGLAAALEHNAWLDGERVCALGGSYGGYMITWIASQWPEHAAAVEKDNPMAHVGRWQTPMLVIQGEKDFRVPGTQGLAAFTALQRRGIPSALIWFPDENHWVLKPHNSLYWHARVNAWLDRWLKASAEPGPGSPVKTRRQ